MSLTAEEISRAAGRLHDAERQRSQIGLLSLEYSDLTISDAYRIQGELVAIWVAEGRRQIGWKIGLTSRAMQLALGITTPDSGVLFDDMLFKDGCSVPKGRFIAPRIEAEIAFVLKAPLKGVRLGRDEVAAALEWAVPALEILDTRIRRKDPESGAARNVCDTIADNAANAGLVLGPEQHPIDGLDLRRVGVIVERNGEVEETGLGAGVLNDPLIAVSWLASRLEQVGAGMREGDIILSGSFIRPIEAVPGSEFQADFGEFGSVGISFM